MNFTEINTEEALNKIKMIINVPIQTEILHDGTIRVEIGDKDYSLVVEGNWTISNSDDSQQEYFNDFVTFKDEEKIENYFRKTKISGLDFVDNIKMIGFIMSNGNKLYITGERSKYKNYFRLISHKDVEENNMLCLTSDFKFMLFPLSDTLVKTLQ